MKRTVLLASLMLAFTTPASALYCGASLVQVGDTQDAVLQKCGQPAYASGRIEPRPGAGWSPWLRDHPLIGNYGLYYNVNPFMPGAIEEWVYNLGPTRMMPRLIFENGVLTTIRYLGYGQ